MKKLIKRPSLWELLGAHHLWLLFSGGLLVFFLQQSVSWVLFREHFLSSLYLETKRLAVQLDEYLSQQVQAWESIAQILSPHLESSLPSSSNKVARSVLFFKKKDPLRMVFSLDPQHLLQTKEKQLAIAYIFRDALYNQPFPFSMRYVSPHGTAYFSEGSGGSDTSEDGSGIPPYRVYVGKACWSFTLSLKQWQKKALSERLKRFLWLVHRSTKVSLLSPHGIPQARVKLHNEAPLHHTYAYHRWTTLKGVWHTTLHLKTFSWQLTLQIPSHDIWWAFLPKVVGDLGLLVVGLLFVLLVLWQSLRRRFVDPAITLIESVHMWRLNMDPSFPKQPPPWETWLLLLKTFFDEKRESLATCFQRLEQEQHHNRYLLQQLGIEKDQPALHQMSTLSFLRLMQCFFECRFRVDLSLRRLVIRRPAFDTLRGFCRCAAFLSRQGQRVNLLCVQRKERIWFVAVYKASLPQKTLKELQNCINDLKVGGVKLTTNSQCTRMSLSLKLV
jgi:hypothetical protein